MKKFALILLIFALAIGCPGCKVHEARFTMHDARYTVHDIARDSIREYDSISFSFTEIPALGGQSHRECASGGMNPVKTVEGAGGALCDFGNGGHPVNVRREQVFEGLHTSTANDRPPLRIPIIHHWHTRTHDRIISHTDTVVVTQRDSIAYPVEVPIEVAKPVSRLYKWCTMGFWLLFLCISLYIFLRIYLHR